MYDEKYFREYDFKKQYPYFHATAVTLVKYIKPKKVLDIGCGMGFFVYAFCELGIDAYGIDISEYAISQSPVKERLTRIDITKDKIAIPSNTFDLVTMMQSIEHLPSIDNVLNEIGRILKPNGMVYITAPSKYSKGAYADPTHINIHSRREWERMFRNHNFKVNNKMVIDLEGEFPFGPIDRKLPKFIRKTYLIRWIAVKTGCKFLLKVEK